jgi:hypothetical protein
MDEKDDFNRLDLRAMSLAFAESYSAAVQNLARARACVRLLCCFDSCARISTPYLISKAKATQGDTHAASRT